MSKIIIVTLICIGMFIYVWRLIYLNELILKRNYKDIKPKTIIKIMNDTSEMTLTSINIKYNHRIDMADYSQLIDLKNFTFLINQKECETMLSESFTIILIHSAPTNIEKRMTIRETWGNIDISKSKIFFLFGSVDDEFLQLKLEQENNLFNDIIQGNFYDSYRNLTYKHVMALKWFKYYCPNANYLLKSDDDIFINLKDYYKFIQSNTIKTNNLIYCKLRLNEPILRNKGTKWYVADEEYSGTFYPPYCPGFVVLYSSDVVSKLYEQSQHNQYFWIDDVHVIGTMVKLSNLNITTIDGDLLLSIERANDILNNKCDINDKQFLFTNPLTEMEIRLLWNKLLLYRSDK